MESMVVLNYYKGKKVFITGHTGFKGSWLTYWLTKLGAEVVGYSDRYLTKPNHYDLLQVEIESNLNDIRNSDLLKKAIHSTNPDIVFHLAAQPLVRYGYQNPLETFETNIMGTANLLEACRGAENIKAIVVVTTDKCYENQEWLYGYRENDTLGGYDPYSASKAGAEVVTSSYRNSFFNIHDFGHSHQTLIATARAGNVIGGGDWSDDRLIPDIVRAAVSNQTSQIRSSNATRPWQHVLEPLRGYLLLGQKLMEGKIEFAEPWNFGPALESNQTVSNVLETSKKVWDKVSFEIENTQINPHEAGLLMLDCSKAYHKLGWKPKWDFNYTIAKTIEWYKAFYEEHHVLTDEHLRLYNETI
jgi:CDP-glucose 4,6-dehydratase